MPEIQESQGLDQDYLSKISERDAKFDNKKSVSAEIARLYGLDTKDGHQGFVSGKKTKLFSVYSQKIGQCGNWLSFVKGKNGLKLVDARFCMVPNCPMCQWRRTLKWRAKFLELRPKIFESWGNHRWVFLTLSMRNCELDNLKDTIKHLNGAFNRLSKNARFPLIGLVKSVEVTRAWDIYDAFTGKFLGRHGSKWVIDYQRENKRPLRLEPTTEVHPHLHVIGIVKPSYFSGNNYIKHSEWLEMWKKALKVEYDPSFRIQTVKCNKSITAKEFDEDNNKADGIIKAVCETLKYTVKEQDLIGSHCSDELVNSKWLKNVTEQLYKTRKVEYRGVFKEIAKELEMEEEEEEDEEQKEENLVNINEDKESTEDKNLEVVNFFWYPALKRYVRSLYQEDEEDSPTAEQLPNDRSNGKD